MRVTLVPAGPFGGLIVARVGAATAPTVSDCTVGAGMARDANEVGDSGEKNRLSCPPTTEVWGQSMRTVAVCSRTRPAFTPFTVFSTPPAKSKRTSVCRKLFVCLRGADWC